MQYSVVERSVLKSGLASPYPFFRDGVILQLKLHQALAVLQFINETLKHTFAAVQVQAYDSLHGVMRRANVFKDPKQGSNVYKCPLPFF